MDTLKIVESVPGLSDTVWLAIIAGIVTIATLIINGRIEAKAKKAEAIAAIEAAKVSEKLKEVEIKIDGRLTQLLELATSEAELRGRIEGKEQQKSEESVKVQETQEIKVTPIETKKKQ